MQKPSLRFLSFHPTTLSLSLEMGSGFVFEAPSDEESEHELNSDDEQQTKSAWDFAAYSEAVAEEHARRHTTSVDQKIQKLRLQKNSSHSNPTYSDSGSDSDSEHNKQVFSFLYTLNFSIGFRILCFFDWFCNGWLI